MVLGFTIPCSSDSQSVGHDLKMGRRPLFNGWQAFALAKKNVKKKKKKSIPCHEITYLFFNKW